jgi:phage terminase large subunit-like protein
VNVRTFTKELEDAETGSTYAALSSDARKAHGLSPVFVVCDELAQWHGRELYENLVTGCGAHAEPLLIVISTMSPDPAHLMSELVRYGEQCRDGEIPDPYFLPIIYSAPPDADPWSEATWRACNPALADFRSLEEMRVAADQAQRLPAREASFRLLYLNQPIDAASRFLNRVDWDLCRATYPSDLAGARCHLGLDLSSTTDLTALAAFFPDTGNLLCWFWSPADALAEAERRDRVPYLTWARTGFLETTPGRAIDKSFVVHRLGEIASEFKVEAVAYDRWGMALVQRLMADEGLSLNMVEFGQGWKDMAPALSATETLVLRRELRHPDHPILNWCVANAVAVSDPAGNRKLANDRSIGRIDGLVAAAMAIGSAARTPSKRQSIYGTRGLLTVEVTGRS